MAQIVHETEHYLLLLSDNPRVTDSGVTMHYEIFCKETQRTEAYAQIFPQGIDVVEDLTKSLNDIKRAKADDKVIKLHK